MTWADAMGLVVHRGHHHPGPGASPGSGPRSSTPCPCQLKVAISVGIGLFIALIGFVDAGFAGARRRVTAAAAGPRPGNQLQGWPVLVFGIGLALVIALWVRKVKGAILITILAMTVVAIVVEKIARHRPGVRGRRRVQPQGLVAHRPERARLR